MSVAKKAVDSTLKKILNYTAEIIMAIILLIFICIPLIFGIPMWFQHVIFGVSRPDLSINPVAWFGLDGTTWITLLLGLVSFGISYFYILKMNPGKAPEDISEEDDSGRIEADVDEEDSDIPLEDIEADEEIPLEDQEAEEEEAPTLEDQEEESDLEETDESIADEE